MVQFLQHLIAPSSAPSRMGTCPCGAMEGPAGTPGGGLSAAACLRGHVLVRREAIRHNRRSVPFHSTSEQPPGEFHAGPASGVIHAPCQSRNDPPCSPQHSLGHSCPS